jgi:hypothetical protein
MKTSPAAPAAMFVLAQRRARGDAVLRLNPHLHLVVLTGLGTRVAASSPGRGSGTREALLRYVLLGEF